MPSDTTSGYPFPDDQDLDRTVAYRTPRAFRPAGPSAGVPQDAGHTRRLPQWDEPEEIGYGTVPGPAAPPPAAPRRRGRGWIVAIVAAVVVGLLSGGGVWAMSRLSGGGSQPQDVLPGGAIAYVRLDLDPSAGQKVALFQIARKFSATRDSFTGDDPRKAVFEALRQGEQDLASIDYARDVEPWLGDRIGLAVLPQSGKGGDPDVALAVQVKDEAAARSGLAKLGAGHAGLAFRDGYALLAPTQRQADAYAAAAPLSHDPGFDGDMKALGEQGVLSFWADLEKVASAAGQESAAALQPLRGARLAGALRFDGSYAELAGVARGGTLTTGSPRPVRIGELPASTVGAAAFSGLGDILGRQWPAIEETARSGAEGESFTRFVEQAKQQYGLALPDDLVTLLGTSLTVAVDEQGLDGDQPNVGAVLATDPDKAGQVLDKLEKFLADSGEPVQLARSSGDGTLVVASSQEYAGRLAQKGALGDDETFRLAVPDAADATYAVYADLDKAEKLYLNGLPEGERADVQALRAVGLSGRQTPTETTLG
ncbi:DUF3352 domain-containing protein, partial [Microbispora sp. ATCC PTA-5024]|uniref:DUF3352 domain-containing protein n=1 Tax=Microbispora sp. ATCC PTA-5024 TaxID=316330 RepID=UPI0003DC7D98